MTWGLLSCPGPSATVGLDRSTVLVDQFFWVIVFISIFFRQKKIKERSYFVFKGFRVENNLF